MFLILLRSVTFFCCAIIRIKSEYQNPKSETNSNDENPKRFEHLKIRILKIVSNFDIRISDLYTKYTILPSHILHNHNNKEALKEYEDLPSEMRKCPIRLCHSVGGISFFNCFSLILCRIHKFHGQFIGKRAKFFI